MLSVLLLFYHLLLAALFQAGPAPALVLQPQPVPFLPREFYLAEVVDARPKDTPLALLLSTAGAAAKPAAQELQGGTLPALREFVRRSVPRNPALRPVTLRVQELQVRETPGPGGTIDGKITVRLAFEWPRQGERVPLVEYRGGAQYRRLPAQQAVVAPALRQALVSGLVYFHTWITQQAPRNPDLATAIEVRFQDDVRQTEPDTLFYDPNRPLAWTDFTGPPRGKGFAAAVFPSFAYQGRPSMAQGKLHLDMTLKVFVVRSSSWTSTQTAEPLRHEQGHFDLVKLVAERFRRKVQPDSLTFADYNSIIQLQYLRSYWEMNRVQEQYDAETRHGQDEAAQQRWNQRIDAELREFKVKS
ncbi:hypothetical protein PK28_00210 [Hymenobacter sp. DG25B]|uniref:hypothetical protein n=1 Tax=Hymenobacter sp. DG25B TaxID=1385664 RepID=UPI000540F7E3|nr:hypothetical protein [Hymenobacter sp. DG25B]AIZ62509.1 hypothetical protein PK28_00210 [Hymenobacter sp. DG25B]